MSIEALIVTLVFITPGFIITGIKHAFHIEKKYSSFNRTIESVLWSLFLYTVISILGTLKSVIMPYFEITINNKSYNFLQVEVYGILWGIIIMSVLVGLIFGLFTKSSFWSGVYERVFNRTIYKSVWHEVYDNFQDNSNGFVEIKFKGSDERYIGILERVSDYDESRELYLSNVHIVDIENPEESQELSCKGLLVKYDSLDYIILSPDDKE